MHTRFSKTPEPPYYAVIFTSQLSLNSEGYDTLSDEILDLALQQPGCLGAESARNSELFGITVSYWIDEESIIFWKQNARHKIAQKLGIDRWYEHYQLRITRVEREYVGPQDRTIAP